jgi:hypothetical protein
MSTLNPHTCRWPPLKHASVEWLKKRMASSAPGRLSPTQMCTKKRKLGAELTREENGTLWDTQTFIPPVRSVFGVLDVMQ